MTVKYITIFIMMAILPNNASNPEVLVETEGGPVQGRIATSFTGRRYASFQGIPYARPPVGSLRFKLESSPQPVLVWLHGGSFINGSGRLYQPDVLLDQGLVVVTLNYRLGALGFMFWPKAGIPGNMGLRDQSLALYWVRRNIAGFGGDAGSITLAGQSAGAASVIFHMMSPLSRGLFDRAVSMSGSALCWWASPANPEERTLRLLRAAGLPPGVRAEDDAGAVALADFLASPAAGPDVLVPRYREALGPQEWVEPILPVLAVCVDQEVEPCIGAFLPDEPWRLLSTGRFHRVPLLAGLTDGEAKFFLLCGGLGTNEALQAMDKNFDQLFPPIMDAELIARIRSFYFGSQPITEKLLINVTNLLADLHVLEPVVRTLRAVAGTAQSPPAYFYLLSHQPRHSFWGTPLHLVDNLGVPGVPHGEDLAVLFPLLGGEPPGAQRVPEDDRVRLYFATAVANFARTGNPVPETNELMEEKWAPFTLEDQAFMNISRSPEMQRNIMADRVEFWRNLLTDLKSQGNNKISQKQPKGAAATTELQRLLKIFISSIMLAAFFE